MRFIETSLPGAWLIELEPRKDDRGYLARAYCEREFAEHGLNTHWPQSNQTLTLRRGTLRGLHWQAEPKPEVKLVRCVSGAIWDVLVDLRRDSSTFGKWVAFELTESNRQQVYIPAGFAHGFQSLTDNSQTVYHLSEFYDPELARGVRWNDPDLGIEWPVEDPRMSERDREAPLLRSLASDGGAR